MGRRPLPGGWVRVWAARSLLEAPRSREIPTIQPCLPSGVQRARAEMSPEEWQAIAPGVMTQPEEIAEAVVRIVNDDSLAGRIMLCVGPKPWPFAEPPKRTS